MSPENAGEVAQVATFYNDATVNDLVFSPDGNSLIAIDLNNVIKVWDVSSGDLVRSWQQTGVWTIAISPDGAFIAGGGTDNKIYIWNFQSGEILQTLQGHTAAVSSIVFNPTCPDVLNCEVGLVSGGFDNRVRLWNLQTGDAEVLSGHVNPVTVVAFNPNGRTATSGSYSGSLIEWNIHTKRQVDTLRGHSGTVSTITYSNGCVELESSCTFLMASSGDDRRILLWDASTGQQLDEMRHTHTATINSLAFSPDGRLLATTGSDFTVRLLDVQRNRELKVLNEHTNFVNTIAFSPSGQLIASGSNDKTIKIWGIEE
jgi:WD40 repeat protein